MAAVDLSVVRAPAHHSPVLCVTDGLWSVPGPVPVVNTKVLTTSQTIFVVHILDISFRFLVQVGEIQEINKKTTFIHIMQYQSAVSIINILSLLCI